ncbi:hypothetical protein [Methylibium rhizosphaerae]|uniref:hypothetical protein n=1 Tax=Methylibium rhizosphaerae TaxID=2570323 RepID=UPI00112878D8|nr:hypothetical protein [Methylibium rhizosphaerae]
MSPTAATRPLLAATALVSALLVGGCASTRLDAQWVDPQLGGTASLRGTKVLVACEAFESVVKQICQDQLAAEVVARGAVPVHASKVVNPEPGRPLPAEQYFAAAREAGAKAVLSATVMLAARDLSPGMSIGIGGFGIGTGRVGVGGGVSVPIGGGQPTAGYATDNRITDVASGRLLWTAKASTPPSADINAQLGSLAKTALGAAEKAGLF